MSNFKPGESELPWIEKYRPKLLSDLVAHEDIVTTIRRLIENKRLPHLLFYGPPGTGKTSTILALAREIFGDQVKSKVLELNASDARGIDTVRNEIQTFAGTKNLFASFAKAQEKTQPEPTTNIKIVVLDEADNMTKDAQMALRRVIEKYSKNTRFCLICNYVSKIIPALQSRCTKFRFSPLAAPQIKLKLDEVILNEHLRVSDEGREVLIQLSQGDMRRVLNLLQATSMAFGDSGKNEIFGDHFYEVAGKPSRANLMQIYQVLLNQDYISCLEKLRQMLKEGIAVDDLVQGLHPLVIGTKLPSKAKIFLLDQLAEIEHRVSLGTSEKLQVASLVGSFNISRDIVGKALAGDSTGNPQSGEAEMKSNSGDMEVDLTDD